MPSAVTVTSGDGHVADVSALVYRLIDPSDAIPTWSEVYEVVGVIVHVPCASAINDERERYDEPRERAGGFIGLTLRAAFGLGR